MARLSKTGSKASNAKDRKTSQIKGRKNAKTKSRSAPAAKVGKRLSVSELEAQLQRRTIELNETLAQQAAATEVLQIINGSGGDLTPVLDVMVTKAAELCDSTGGGLYLVEGDKTLNYGGTTSRTGAAPSELMGVPLASILGPNPQDRPFVHVVDLKATKAYRNGVPFIVASVERDMRSWLGVPVISDGVIVAVFALFRKEVRPFSENQIRLLQSFAVQVSTAMKNARLFNETKEALEQQAATAEILKVINSSPNDLAPVFDIILEKARSLCDVTTGSLELYEGDIARSVAVRGMNVHWEQYLRQGYKITETLRPAYMAVSHSHVIDMKNTVERFPDEPALRDFVEIGGLRTFLALPLVKDGIVFGRIVATRAEVRPFTVQQISLLQSFADQAVVAIENARLLSEQRELLEQQTATAEILKVINSSPGDLAPVFDIILEKAHSLCDVTIGSLELIDGDFVRAVAQRGTNDRWQRWLSQGFRIPEASARFYKSRRPFHVADMGKFPDESVARAAVEIGGLRTLLALPLVKDDIIIGRIVAARDEVRPFTDKQITLLKNFADQAVIAIENARLLTEQREALERQTATADILKVISSSVADTTPVFEQILDSCERLAAFNRMAIFLLGEDGQVHIGAYRGAEGDALKAAFPQPIANTPMSLAFERQKVLFFADVLNNSDAPESLRIAASRMGSFSVLVAPLLWEGRGIGAFHVARNADATFSDREVALLKTFADQAAIAIQNARLFNETREALEQQKASADILAVISSSVADAQPVFDKILVSCKHLFGGDELDVLLVDEQGQLNIAAYIGDSHDVVAATFPAPVERTPAGRAIRERRVMHWPDLVDGEDVPGVLRKMAKLIGYRSMVFAPMLWEGRGIGAIGVGRSTGPFKPKELAMIQTFADQAVIAIQNARLFNETREALERQTATADILKVIASSPSDVQPVFEAIAERSKRLVDALSTTVFRLEDGVMHLRAFTPTNPEADATLKAMFPAPLSNFSWSAAIGNGEIYRVVDTELEIDGLRELARLRGFRSMLFVPLLRDRKPIGVIAVTRVESGPFVEHHVQLLQTFADQAVIAIDNVRLFDEVQARTNDLSESLRQQTAVGDVLKTISRSTFDLQPVLDTLVQTAAQLCDTEMAFIMRREGDVYRAGAAVGYSQDYIEFVKNHPLEVDRGTITGRAVLERRTVQILDTATDPEYRLHESTSLAGQHTALCVPLLRENQPIGTIVLARQRVEAFTPKQIELVTTFADQAVIAIENVRLFDQVQARTRELSQSLDDLRTAQDRLVQTEKLASLGQLTAGIAHEIKNPLNFVNNFSALSANTPKVKIAARP